MIKEPKEGAGNWFETEKEETEFKMKIFKKISKRNQHQNVIISPISIFIVLSLFQAKEETLSTNQSFKKYATFVLIQYFSLETPLKIPNEVLTNLKIPQAFRETCEQFDSFIDELNQLIK